MKKTDFEFKYLFREAILNAIADLKRQGATFQEIADYFNQNNFDTINNVKDAKWHAPVVHKLYHEI